MLAETEKLAIRGGGFTVARWLFGAILVVVSSVSMDRSCSLFAQETYADQEAKIKAAYLYKFIQYVEWPETAFAAHDSPLVIGSVGDDLVNKYLRLIADQRKAGQRDLVYRPNINEKQAQACHILFVSDQASRKTFEAIIRHIQKQPILLVGEWSGFAESEGVIGFVFIENNVRLKISLETASQRGLTISSQLAKIAKIVD